MKPALVRGAAVVVLLGALVGGVSAWQYRGELWARIAERTHRATRLGPQLPASVTASPTPTESAGVPLAVRPAPADVNLAVPFAPQAPQGNWAQPYQDACEEAAVIMVERSLRAASLSSKEMDAEILRMVRFQQERYGDYRDTNTTETASLAEAFFPHVRAEVRFGVTADDLRSLLRAGQPVIVLVDGRKLGNPFYRQPGPDKHALVLKGLVGDRFVANDPGTRRGADFVYTADRLFAAMVDYDGRSPGTKEKSALLLTPRAAP